MAKTEMVQVAVEPKMKQLLQERAKTLDLSVSYVIRTAIEHYFSTRPQGKA